MNILKCKRMLENYPKYKIIFAKIYNSISFNKKNIKGKHNSIVAKTTFMKKTKIIINGSNNKIYMDDMCFLINTVISVSGDNNEIYLGRRVYVNNGDFYIEDSNNKIDIGEHTFFAGNTHIAVTEGTTVKIGKDCMFSSNIVLRTGDSHTILDKDDNRINYAKNINIDMHVWFTQNVTILKGVNIAKDSIIATGSIVTKSIKQPGVVIAGNPGKIVKENINWKKERI